MSDGWKKLDPRRDPVLAGWIAFGLTGWALVEMKTDAVYSGHPGTLGVPFFIAWILGPLLLAVFALRGRHLPHVLAIVCVSAGILGEIGIRYNGDQIRDAFGYTYVSTYAVEHGYREYSLAYRPVHLTTVPATRQQIGDEDSRKWFSVLLYLVGTQSWLTPALLLLAWTERHRARHAGTGSVEDDWFTWSASIRLFPRLFAVWLLIWLIAGAMALGFVMQQGADEPDPRAIAEHLLQDEAHEPGAPAVEERE